MRMDNGLHNGHAQSGAALEPRTRGVGSVEPFKDAVTLVRTHPGTVVAHNDHRVFTRLGFLPFLFALCFFAFPIISGLGVSGLG